MEEQIYQDVWVRVFANIYIRLLLTHTPTAAATAARSEANWAAHAAVQAWDESKRLAAITAKNQENP